MRSKLLLSVAIGAALAGCGPKAEVTAPETVQLNGLNITMVEPSKWASKKEHSETALLVDPGAPKSTGADNSVKTGISQIETQKHMSSWEAIVFESPSGTSRIVVTALANVPKLGMPQLDAMSDGVIKRGGDRTKKDYYQDVAGDKQNGFTMEYELHKGTALAERGKQVAFVQKGQMIQLSLDDKAADYPADVADFDALVHSLQLK
jgi:hypothetical protein